MRSILFWTVVLLAPVQSIQAQAARPLHAGDRIDSTITPAASHDYLIRLARGTSVDLVVTQRGVDLALELSAPDGSALGVFDSPNGRNGDEPLEIIAAQSGTYRLRVRTYDAGEPTGPYTLTVRAWRSVRQTRALLRTREISRDAASAWLRQRSVPIPGNANIAENAQLVRFDSLAAGARILGIGEATHGSAEFGSLRLSLTRRLIERFGYRIVAIEASAARLRLLNDYILGESQTNSGGPDELHGWIGVTSRRELVPWLRAWNDAHPADRVHLVGLDPQDNLFAHDSLRAFLTSAYGAEVVSRLTPMFTELAAADSQAMVFGNSDIDSTSRQALFALNARLNLDAPLLARRFGPEALENARSLARDLAQMADFNGGGPPVSHSRDFYMAANILAAMERRGADSKVVFWSHNSHVAHPEGQSDRGRSTGGWLRQVIGCDYAALGVTFGEGAFVAQIPNDPAARLAVFTAPFPDAESIESVLRPIDRAGSITTWGCGAGIADAPAWLQDAQRMHWVGGLWSPGSSPGESLRPHRLLADFDGIAFIGTVTADEMPVMRPVVRARPTR